ncbi:peptidase M16C associated-domain-containing protein [Scheffersomyces xylosifermentans]|uniref:peptidase M16C associated-domain-containing protein n=1 Tax=Scheffersomyces xylosifermentans TaxID=1304137 RepID=UPI00315CB45E
MMLRQNRRLLARSVKSAALTTRLLATSVSQASTLSKYPIGLNVHGFVIEDVKPIPEFSLVAVSLKHQASGAQHLHLDSPTDSNNVFSIAFKTNPPDATGVPHILEHTTLCGSYKYPVRDPFFKMTNRSLSNFMNAMTGHDFTFYPYATTNAKDFENLMDVYLSSVFEPLLTYNDFIQEGWRLENENVEDPKSKLELKGVVYNEMKGQNSNTSYYFYIRYLESIYPSLNNSGGDPAKIPDLQYEDLVEFHNKNYHPSNARTFTYGTLPLVNHLQRMNEYFKGFGTRSRTSDVKFSIFNDPKGSEAMSEVTLPGPIESMSGKTIEEQYKASITWNLGNALDESKQYDLFKWKILSSLLCDGHNAPFYQELIESEYGDDFSANSGIDTTTALLSFTMGLNNLTVEKVDKLESKIMDIIQSNVLPELENPNSTYKDRVAAILHQIELNFKRHKPDFGLGLLNAIVPTWVNGLDPVLSLQVEPILNQFKADYEKNGLQIFKELLVDSLLNPKTQKFKFIMKPDVDFNKKLADKESERVDQMVSNLSDEDRTIIHKRGLELARKQAEEQDGEVLPTLTIADIPKQGEFYPLDFSNINNKTLQKRIVDTNGLIYAAASKDISYLPTKYYKYLSLFSSCLTNLAGTWSTSITELETKIQRLTGGVSFNSRVTSNPYNINEASLNFSLSGMALKDNSENIYNLWYEILTDTKFDANDELVVDKLFTLIKSMGQNQLNVIADRGHSYANGVSNSKLVASRYISDITSGMSQVGFGLELNSNLEAKGKQYLVDEVLPILKDIQRLIIDNSKASFKYRLVGDKDLVDSNEKLLKQFDDKFTIGSKEDVNNELQSLVNAFNSNKLGINANQQTLINLPFQVSYASLGKVGAEYMSKDGATLQILSQLYTFKHLHSVIREANGAYGGGLTYDGLGGTLNFYSYRDPNPLKSVESFKKSFDYGLSVEWEPKDLQEAKLRIFQSVDAPTNIASQGSTEFYEGITDEMRQERRENFLSVNNQDLTDVIQRYLVGQKDNSTTVIGDNSVLNVGDDWTVRELKI